MTIYYEGAVVGQENIRTLADRATHAAGRMLESYSTTAMRRVPCETVVAVGTFDFGEGRITLTGSHSERDLADWLGVLRLSRAELIPGARQAVAGVDVADPAEELTVAVSKLLGEALIERAGIRRDAEGLWIDRQGRHTSAVTEALTGRWSQSLERQTEGDAAG